MVDAELDVFQVRFNPDQISPFKIRADGVTHISIDTCQLQRTCGLKFDADELWAMLEPHWSDEVGGWQNWSIYLSATIQTMPASRTRTERECAAWRAVGGFVGAPNAA